MFIFLLMTCLCGYLWHVYVWLCITCSCGYLWHVYVVIYDMFMWLCVTCLCGYLWHVYLVIYDMFMWLCVTCLCGYLWHVYVVIYVRSRDLFKVNRLNDYSDLTFLWDLKPWHTALLWFWHYFLDIISKIILPSTGYVLIVWIYYFFLFKEHGESKIGEKYWIGSWNQYVLLDM